jgi:unspecific peroxygenase
LTNARGFFQNNQMPADFFRANRSIGLDDIGYNMRILFNVHPIKPGRNEGGGSYVPDPNSATLGDTCLLYTNFVNQTVRSLYPEPTGDLLHALNDNLDNFYGPLKESDCSQIFPFGK